MPRGMFKRSDEHRRHISEALKGRVFTDEWREKISQALKGKKLSEIRAEASRKVLAKHSRLGVPVSDETRAKLAESHKGKTSLLLKYGISPEEYAQQVAAGNRWCFVHKGFSSATAFGNATGCCNECRTVHYRKSDLKRKFGVTPKWYDAKLAEQGGGCGICGNARASSGDRHLAVDHNHKTGKVRGILCIGCNTAIERVEAIPDWYLRAAKYLAHYGE